MEASDLLHSPIFGSAHSLTDRTNLNSSAMTSDSAASLLFARNVISGFGGSVTTAAANRSPASTRPSVLSTSTVSNNHNSSAGAAATDSMSICQMNNTNAALMNAFGLANGLQLPAGLWENSLFNAALSQYIDANAPLVRCSIQNATRANIDQLRSVPANSGAALAGPATSNIVTNPGTSTTSVPLNLQTVASPSSSSSSSLSGVQCNAVKDECGEMNTKKSTAKRPDHRPPMPLKKMRVAEAQAAANKELVYLEQGKSFPCPECHKTFATEVDLKAHLLRHVMQHPFSCPTCGKGFKYEHTLDFHMKSQHGQDAGTSPKLNLKNSSKKNALALANRRIESDDRQPMAKLLKSNKHPAASVHQSNALQPQQQQQQQQWQTQSGTLEMTETEDMNNNQVLSLSLKASKVKNMASMPTTATTANCGDVSVAPLESTKGSGNLAGSGLQVKSEKVLIVQLEGTNPLNDQTYTLFKCNLCGYSQAKLLLVAEHVQTQHSQSNSTAVSNACDKYGVGFKWPNELLIHEQLSKAIDQATGASGSNNGSPSSSCPPGSLTNSNAFKSLLMPPLLQSNLLLMNQYLNATAAVNVCASNAASANLPVVSNCADTSTSAIIGESSTLNLTKSLSGHETSRTVPDSLCRSPIEMNNEMLMSLDCSAVKHEPAVSPTASSGAVLKELSGNGVQQPTTDANDHFALNSNKAASRKDSESSSQESNTSRKGGKLVLKELRSDEIDELSKNIAVVKEHTKSGLGEIEETAPGQFKCRFCEKTFDRIFSVHRHERVHTGFKPCICKVCGRGFSEKRNLRHHIIRFHSDGSGRELLRRVRKDKSGSAENEEARRQLKEMEFGLLVSGDMNGESRSNAESDVECEVDECGDDNVDSNESGESGMERDDSSLKRDTFASGSVSVAEQLAACRSSSRRRKSMPCKKPSIVSSRKRALEVDEEEDDDENENEVIDDDEEDDDVDEDECFRSNRTDEDEKTQDLNCSDDEDHRTY